MSIIGAYRESGVVAATSVSSSAGIVNFTGFKPSGITHGNAFTVVNSDLGIIVSTLASRQFKIKVNIKDQTKLKE